MTPCLRKRGGPRTTKARQIEVVGGVVDEPDDGLAHLNDLDVTWGFDLAAFLQECTQ